ncbi:MAG: TolC family protein [Phycisphaerales bacterium]|nr:TolC family protein [Phycisphaerales bacterium]
MMQRIACLLMLPSLISACGRPHPLAEWSPDDFAPATPDRTWSTTWWPSGTGQMPAVPAAPQQNVALIDVDGSLTLASTLDIALAANPDTRIAWADARAAAAEFGISRGSWYPNLTAWADVAYERDLEPFGGPNNIIRDDSLIAGPGITMTWTLLDFGRREAGDEMTARALLASNFRFNREIQDVVYAVQSGFFRLEAAEGLLDAAESDFALASTVMRSLEERMMLGLATLPEVLSAKQAEALAGYEVQVAHTAIHDARTDLLVSMGIQPGTNVDFTMDADRPLPPDIELGVQGLTAMAMAARPDLAAAAADVQASQAAVKGAEATLNPQVDFVGLVGYQYTDYKLDPFINFTPPSSGSQWNTYWSTGISGSWLFFDGEIRQNEIRKAKAELTAARERMRQAQLDAAGEVWDSYFDYEAATRRHEWSLAVEEAADEQLDAVQMAFDTGLQTFPELLTAQQALASARAHRIRSRADVLISAASIVHATGDLKIN